MQLGALWWTVYFGPQELHRNSLLRIKPCLTSILDPSYWLFMTWNLMTWSFWPNKCLPSPSGPFGLTCTNCLISLWFSEMCHKSFQVVLSWSGESAQAVTFQYNLQPPSVSITASGLNYLSCYIYSIYILSVSLFCQPVRFAHCDRCTFVNCFTCLFSA